uniref:Pectinesterase inhibitor domain-containing protein n=1 Tax=Oryza barthii TaxID=65489 RepID=A0A0D3GZ70_9ORYZ
MHTRTARPARQKQNSAMTTAMASSSSLRGVTVPFLMILPLLFVVAALPAEVTVTGDGILLPSCKTVGGGSTYFDVQFCLDALGSARSSLEESAAAARRCEDGFRGGNATSPVTAEDDAAFKLAKLGVALLGFA